MRSILIIAATIFATSAYAQQLPLPKSGGCPPGFRESGAYCVAGEDTRRDDAALQPDGQGQCF